MKWRKRRCKKGNVESYCDSSDSSGTTKQNNRRLRSCLKRDGESSLSDVPSSHSGCSSQTLSSRHDAASGSSRLSEMSNSSRGSLSETLLQCHGPQEKQASSSGACIDSKSLPNTGKSMGSRSSASRPTMVQFNSVEIRDYERILGDNPSCSSGAPVGYV